MPISPSIKKRKPKARRKPVRRSRVRKFLHYVFDEKRANRAVRFIEEYCHLNKGYAGQPFKMLPFHRECTEELFGWIDPATGLRRYRRGYISTGRKNAKSSWCAGVALYCLLAEEEPSPEVVLAANARHQAGIVFDACSSAVEPSSMLRPMVQVIPSTKRIICKEGGGILKAVSAEATTEIGGNISCLIYDEVSFALNRELFDAVTSASGARRQPLKLFVSTAGYDVESLGHDLYQQAKAIERDPELDPTFFVCIREVPKEADWSDERNWYLANPALGKFLSIEELRENFREAERSVAAQIKFRVLHLNQWVQAAESWLDLQSWQACEDAEFDESQLIDRPCQAGVDLSSRRDLSALVLIFPLDDGRHYIQPHFFLPDADLRARVLRDHVPYDGWTESGHLTLTPGKSIDYGFIRARLKQLADRYKIQSVGFDPWNAGSFITDLESDGFECVEVRQGPQSMSDPSKEFESWINSRKIVHKGNPLMKWMVGNVSVRQDSNGNIIPCKKKSRHRIDGITASIVALDRVLRASSTPPKKPASFRVHVFG